MTRSNGARNGGSKVRLRGLLLRWWEVGESIVLNLQLSVTNPIRLEDDQQPLEVLIASQKFMSTAIVEVITIRCSLWFDAVNAGEIPNMLI